MQKIRRVVLEEKQTLPIMVSFKNEQYAQKDKQEKQCKHH